MSHRHETWWSLRVVVCAFVALTPVVLNAQQGGTRTRVRPSPTARTSPKAPFEVPGWPWPVAPPTAPAPIDSVTLLHVPTSDMAFTVPQLRDQFNVPDWYPASHAPMPPIVAHGRKAAVIACGYCHLPDGGGRPENATLAGLPVDYIVQQIVDFLARTRKPAWNGPSRPSELMRIIADSVTDAEVLEAARYFSTLRPRQRARVIEATNIPAVSPALGLYVRKAGTDMEPLGARLIEMPVDAERHELRDAAAEYVAYVPMGSLARGRRLANVPRSKDIKSCAGCHGPQLRGLGLVPPIAGRSPSYLLRQLLAFRSGARSTAASTPMSQVAATLSLDDMIAAAAFAGSRRP